MISMDPSQLSLSEVPMKCRKCRFVLLWNPTVRVEGSHGQPCRALLNPGSLESQNTKQKDFPCKSDVWYIPEECMPEWISNYLDKGDWVKGKINCPNITKCNARIGSYNFVSGLRCPCGTKVVPPIHIVKAKVDFVHQLNLSETPTPTTTTHQIND